MIRAVRPNESDRPDRPDPELVEGIETEIGVATAGDAPPAGPRGGGIMYAVALVIQRAFGLLLLPLYADYLSPGEYGQLALVLAISLAASFLLTFGLETAILRTWIRLADDPERRERWITTVATFLLVAPLAASGVIIALAVASGVDPFGLPESWLALGLLGAGLYATATVLPFSLLRAQERLRPYMILSLVFGVGGAALTTLFVVFLDLGVEGWLLGRILGAVATLLIALPLVPWPRPRRSRMSRAALTGALAFGLPLLPHFGSQWALGVADRIILGGLVSDTDLGIYALAATLAAGVLLVLAGLGQASMPTYARAQDPAADIRPLTALITQQVALFSLIGLAAALLLPVAINDLFPASYSEAAALTPPLVLAFTIAGLYYVPMNTVTLVAGATRWIWTASLAAALVNVGVLYVLVSDHGIDYAVLGPLAGYTALLIATSIYARRTAIREIPYEWSRILVSVALMGGLYAACALVSSESGIESWLVRLLAIAAGALGAAAITGVLPSRR